MTVTKLELPGLAILEPTYFTDHRGWFCESYSRRTLEDLGITYDFVQDNHSRTEEKGTLRGIHFQNDPAAQAKLVRCTRGAIMDVAVDLRRGSPTYKKWVMVELSENNHRQLLIPVGYGHGFVTLEKNCEVQYKAAAYYEPSLERSIAWNDPDLAIRWGVTDPVLSQKDANAPTLEESDVNFRWDDTQAGWERCC